MTFHPWLGRAPKRDPRSWSREPRRSVVDLDDEELSDASRSDAPFLTRLSGIDRSRVARARRGWAGEGYAR